MSNKKQIVYVTIYLNNKAVINNKPREFLKSSCDMIDLNKREWVVSASDRKRLSSQEIQESTLINILREQLPPELFLIINFERASESNRVSGQSPSFTSFQYEVRNSEAVPHPNIHKEKLKLRNRQA